MDVKDKNIFGPNKLLVLKNEPLVLKDEINSSLNIKDNKNSKILKINDLIKQKYLSTEKIDPTIINYNLDKNFDNIRQETNKINNVIKNKTLLINDSINSQKKELKLLYQEKKLLNKNRQEFYENKNHIQSEIINNQQKLIESSKKNNKELKFNFNKVKTKLEETIYSNRSIEINNNELKNTVGRYISRSKKLEDEIKQLKKTHSDTTQLNTEQINEINFKIKFYQEENIRLSSDLVSTQKKYEVIKKNFSDMELEKNKIFKQIQELNNSLSKTNIVGTPFTKELINEDSINSKVLNDITKNNLEEDLKTSKPEDDLDGEINDIFK